MTDNFAIPYPCGGDSIDCTVFQPWAEAIQAAVSSVRDTSELALNKPAAAVQQTFSAATFAPGVTAVITYDVEDFDNNNMVNLSVNNDRITVRTAGVYLVIASSAGVGPTTTLTSEAVGITRNGVQVYRKKSGILPQGPQSLQVIGILGCAVGDVLQANFLWTGTGGPQAVEAYFQARLVARI